ncbi:hypothetical protein [Frigoriglobus tundricola]|uniref:Uncharacterized protein n=1 Tax=Frigoriglobus tundricola TaxID=2774151 RepID=A0A6M5YNF1_9BACT|nr:hypothetical protein [Frigoriglobus tundricola]QJW95505.1 hypothetical protein FTUN_3054 [Frigoriglobus tundricola]
MFENAGSRRASGGKNGPALGLESLEDRTTPAAAPLLDQAFLAESARLDMVQAWLGMVEATRGANSQTRAAGEQLYTTQLNALNQITPVLRQLGLSVQLSSFDTAIAQELPTRSAAEIDSQFLALSTMDAIQAAALDRTELRFSSNSAAVSFAEAQLLVTQQELLTEVDLLGAGGAANTLSLFEALGGFSTSGIGSPGTTGFGAIGAPDTSGFSGIALTSTGQFGPATATAGFGPANSNGSSSSEGFGPANTAGGAASGGFGPASTVGGAASGGFGPASTAGGAASGGFGPGATFGSNNGFGPASTTGF